MFYIISKLKNSEYTSIQIRRNNRSDQRVGENTFDNECNVLIGGGYSALINFRPVFFFFKII